MMASVIFDIVLLVFAILIIVKFSIKGFVRSLLDVAKIALSLTLAFLLRFPVARLFDSWFMDGIMIDVVKNSLIASVENDLPRVYIDVMGFPDVFKDFLKDYSLDLDKFNSDIAAFSNGDTDVIDSLANNAGGALATLASTVIAFAIVLVISYIILSIVFYFISHLRRFEDVKTADRIFGIILGVIVACFSLWMFAKMALWVMGIITSVLPEYKNNDFADRSMVVSFTEYINNVVERIIRFFNKK